MSPLIAFRSSFLISVYVRVTLWGHLTMTPSLLTMTPSLLTHPFQFRTSRPRAYEAWAWTGSNSIVNTTVGFSRKPKAARCSPSRCSAVAS